MNGTYTIIFCANAAPGRRPTSTVSESRRASLISIVLESGGDARELTRHGPSRIVCGDTERLHVDQHAAPGEAFAPDELGHIETEMKSTNLLDSGL